MRSRTAAEIADLVGGELIGAPDLFVSRVVTDTRGALREGDLFAALAGPHFDGNSFASAAFAAGARTVMVTREVPLPVGAAMIVVGDALAALHAVAASARGEFAGTLVAITGSNGKTTVKDMLSAALGPCCRVWASPMSYNSQVGVAVSLLAIDPLADVALVECGISRPGEMTRLAAIVQPDAGVFVTVSDAHLEGLGSRAVTAREKASLFASMPAGGWCVVPESEVLAMEALRSVGASVEAVAELSPPMGTGVLATDMALALTVVRLLGFSVEDGRGGLKSWTPAPMRLEISETPRGVVVINDAYTADPGSVESALGVLVSDSGSGRTLAVLGGMAQQGDARTDANRAVGARVHELEIDFLVGVGVGGAEIADGAREAGMVATRVLIAADVTAAGVLLEQHARAGDRVLLKGSRPERFERIAPQLFGALAPSRAYIDLDGVVDNYRSIRALAEVPVMCVVKSFGYGLNAKRLGRALERAGAEAFCVAYSDEGVELRHAGIRAPILVQNVVPSDVDKLAAYELDAEIGHPAQLGSLAVSGVGGAVGVHLKIDTGMGRAGVRPGGALALAREVLDTDGLSLRGVMTHFAAADDSAQDAFTREQIAVFRAEIDCLAEAGIEPEWVHAANSAAAIRFPESRFSMVRAGIGLLGYGGPELAERGNTRPVLRLASRVIATKTLRAGDSVGYGRTYRATGPRLIAMVAIGYGDGYPRALSNCGWMSVDGICCPVVGRVCMDVSMIDVSDVRREIRSGDEVVVYGPAAHEPDLAALAEVAGTIPYELLTRLTGRIRRIYASER
jgi:alanine racemase